MLQLYRSIFFWGKKKSNQKDKNKIGLGKLRCESDQEASNVPPKERSKRGSDMLTK